MFEFWFTRNGSSNSADLILRKPSWLPTSSVRRALCTTINSHYFRFSDLIRLYLQIYMFPVADLCGWIHERERDSCSWFSSKLQVSLSCRLRVRISWKVSLHVMFSPNFMATFLTLLIFCCSEDSQRKENRDKCIHRNKFVSLSENVTGCTAHPLNSMIVAGTQVFKFSYSINQF